MVFRGVMRSRSQHYRAEHAQLVLNTASLQETLADPDLDTFSDVTLCNTINNFNQAMELNTQKEKALVKRLRYCLQITTHLHNKNIPRAKKALERLQDCLADELEMLTIKHEEGEELEIRIVDHESSLFDANVAEAMRDEYALFKGMVELAEELY